MRLDGPPRPWFTVPTDAVVLWKRTPHVVKGISPPVTASAHYVVFLEGLDHPLAVDPISTVQVVELDDTDAMLNMLDAGFTPVVLDTRETR